MQTAPVMTFEPADDLEMMQHMEDSMKDIYDELMRDVQRFNNLADDLMPRFDASSVPAPPYNRTTMEDYRHVHEDLSRHNTQVRELTSQIYKARLRRVFRAHGVDIYSNA